MKIDEKLVENVAFLSRLEISEKEKFISEMQKIVDFFEVLKEINTEGIEPMYTPLEDNFVLKERQAERFDDIDEIRKNFPEREGNYLKVPGIHK